MFARVIGALTTFVLARILSVDQFGQLDFILGCVSLLVVFASLQTEAALVRLYHLAGDEQKVLLGSHLIFVSILGAVLAVIVWAWGDMLLGLLSQGQWDGVRAHWVAPLILSGLWFSHVLSFLRTSRRANQSVIFSCSVIFIQLLLTLPLAYVWKIQGVLVARVLAEVVGALWMVLKYLSEYRWVLSFYWVKRSTKYGIPLLPEMMAMGVVGNVCRVLLLSEYGAASIGIFAVATKVSLIVGVFVGAFKTAWLPHIFSLADNPGTTSGYDTPGKKYLDVYLKSLFFLSLGIMLFSSELITVLVSDRYIDAVPIVGILCMSILLHGIVVVMKTPFLESEDTVMVMGVSLFSVLISCLAAILVIPEYGVVGAAFINMGAYLISAGLFFYFSPQRSVFFTSMIVAFCCIVFMSLFSVFVIPQVSRLGFFNKLICTIPVIGGGYFMMRNEISWIVKNMMQIRNEKKQGIYGNEATKS